MQVLKRVFAMCLTVASALLFALPQARAQATQPHPPWCDGIPHTGPASAVPANDLPSNGLPPAAGSTTDWGNYFWQEPALGCKWVGLTFDYWPAANGYAGPRPTILYFHPNEASSHVKPGAAFDVNVIQPATQAGYNVLSVEFRHPVTDQYLAKYNNGQVFHTDVGLFVMWLRQHAAQLNVSTNNIFSFGYSRGTLSLWQALQPDMGGPGTGLPSSLVSAVIGYQAQTTYQCDEYGTLFLQMKTDPDSVAAVQNCKDTNWMYPQFGSAVDSVTSSSVPVMLQYQLGFELQGTSRTLIRKVTYAYLIANYEEEHYPDYGIALYDAYGRKSNRGAVYPQAFVPYDQQFIGWQSFIQPLVQPDAAP